MSNTDNLTIHELPAYWSLKLNEPNLYKKIVKLLPSINVINNINPFPAQKNVRVTTESDTIVRPYRHFRSFYYPAQELNLDYKGYIALKGTEVFAENIDELLKKIKAVHSIYSWSTRKSGLGLHNSDHALLPMADRYLFVENKIPLLYLLSEAVEEVNAAVNLQKAYLDSYQTLARIPIPLAIYKIPEESLKAADSIFKNFYDEKRYKLVKNFMDEGIAIQIYWYPNVPKRAAHIAFSTAASNAGFQERIAYLSSIMDIEKCVENWILLFCRFLNLGFIPADPIHACKGYCIDPGNLVLDGGMVDMGSIRHIDSFHYSGEIQFALENSIKLLIESIMALLIGKESMSYGFKSVFPDLSRLIYQNIEKNINIDSELGRFIHPYIKNWCYSKYNYKEIIEKLTNFFEL
ncbi:hypothetical protein ACFORL_09805 [Legionella dresdenensis]|uniref:Glutamate--cysteine ligase n=1 Tax=Legionella dresdenensis TaxID=450200 RepID=A0ABV8CGD9_9GAMM